jgi:hypothetical protein
MSARSEIVVALCGALVLAATAGAQQESKVDLKVSKETTYVQGPVNPDGTVNYVRAYNEVGIRHIKPDKNAAHDLIVAIGPALLPTGATPRMKRDLDLPDGFDKAPGFAPLEKFLDNAAAASRALADATGTPWPALKHPEVARWLEANNGVLDAVAEAVKKGQYFVPLFEGRGGGQSLDTALAPDRMVYQQVGKALTARAMLKLAEGKVDEAWADALAASALGRLISGAALLPWCQTGMQIDSDAADAVRNVLDSGNIPPSKIEQCAKSIADLPEPCDLHKAVDFGGRLTRLSDVMELIRLGPRQFDESQFMASGAAEGEAVTAEEWRWARAMINWNTVTTGLNSLWDGYAAALGRKDPGAQTESFRQMREEFEDMLRRAREEAGAVSPTLAAQNRLCQAAVIGLLQDPSTDMDMLSSRMTGNVSNVLMASDFPPIAGDAKARDRLEAAWNVDLVALALEAYKATKGGYPEKLADLPAERVASHLKDPCGGGKDLRYYKAGGGYVLYSVGRNERDDGGKTDPRQGQDDIVIRRH